MNYQKAYALLVTSMSNAIDQLEKSKILSQETSTAISLLKEGLKQTEEMYISTFTIIK